jgi:hypothetical protein
MQKIIATNSGAMEKVRSIIGGALVRLGMKILPNSTELNQESGIVVLVRPVLWQMTAKQEFRAAPIGTGIGHVIGLYRQSATSQSERQWEQAIQNLEAHQEECQQAAPKFPVESPANLGVSPAP